jgi:hypothetical protein
MHRVITRVAAAVAIVVLVGCEKKSDGAADTGDAMHPSNDEVSNPCMLNYGAQKCANVLGANWEKLGASDQYAEISTLFPNPSKFAFSPRRYDTTCQGKQPMHKIRAATDALKMPRTAGWAANVWVAMGKFEPEDNDKECPDAMYNVGGIKGAEYYLVAQLKTTPTQHTKGRSVGKWAMLAFTNNGTAVTTLKTGDFVACTNLHDPPLTLEQGEFQDCNHKDTVSFIADSLKISREEVIAAIVEMRRDSSMVPKATPASTPTRTLSVPVQIRLFQSGAARNDNPAWISCALGCCVSVDPDVTNPPEDSTKKSTDRRRGPTVANR